MSTTDTNVPQVIVNKLTSAEYATATKSPTEFYAVTDGKIETADIADGAVTTAKATNDFALVGTTLSTPTNVAYVATANIQDGAVTAAKASFTNYSTTEQVVGTWINGKPLYEKIIDLGALPNNTSKQENIAGGTKVMTISVEAYMYPDPNSSWSAYARAIPYQSLTSSNAIGLYYSEYVVGVTTNYNASAFNAYAKVRYWKTTD